MAQQVRSGGVWWYDAARDGQRFAITQNMEEDEETTPTITVVQNWIKEFEGK